MVIGFKKLQEYIENCRMPDLISTNKSKGTSKFSDDRAFDSKQYLADSKTSS